MKDLETETPTWKTLQRESTTSPNQTLREERTTISNKTQRRRTRIKKERDSPLERIQEVRPVKTEKQGGPRGMPSQDELDWPDEQEEQTGQ